MYSWSNAELTHEGFPLFLRRPIDADTPVHRRTFGFLAIITHTFTKRLPDGRPEPDYNRGLAGLDKNIIGAFDAEHTGVPVLIETFGGKRHYYFYVRDKKYVSELVASFKVLHPGEQLAGDVRTDPKWGFLDEYAAQFFGTPEATAKRTALGGWLSRLLRAFFRR